MKRCARPVLMASTSQVTVRIDALEPCTESQRRSEMRRARLGASAGGGDTRLVRGPESAATCPS